MTTTRPRRFADCSLVDCYDGLGRPLCPDGVPVIISSINRNVAFPAGWTEEQCDAWRELHGVRRKAHGQPMVKINGNEEMAAFLRSKARGPGLWQRIKAAVRMVFNRKEPPC